MNKFLRNISFSAHLLNQSKCRPSLIYLQSYIMIEDDVLCISAFSLATQQIPIFVKALEILYFSSSCQQKQTYLNSHKALMTFHHNDPNSHVPGFHFLEFLVIALSTRTHCKSAKHRCSSHTASAENLLYLLLKVH